MSTEDDLDFVGIRITYEKADVGLLSMQIVNSWNQG